MKKNKVLKIVNPIIGILFVLQAGTGFFHEKISYKTFELIHGGGGTLLTIFVIIHIILNWSWIKSNFFTKKK